MSRVNIILATYNGELYIREQLDSIMNSDFKDFTLNICDDCSTDSTPEIIREYQEKYPKRIKLYFNESNMGSTRGFLYNLKRVSKENPSKYYMFSDQDDVWLNDKIGLSLKTMSKLEKRKGSLHPILVFNDALIVNQDLKYVARSFYKTNRLKVHKTGFNRMLIENKCIGCTMMMNHSLVNLISDYDPVIRYHDWWVALAASAFGTIRYIKTPTLLYRQHGNNQVGQSTFGDYVKKRTAERDDVKDRLKSTYDQAEYFEKAYGQMLKANRRRHLNSFLKLKNAGFFTKRFIILKNHFFKSGFFRNVGLLFYI